MIDTKTFDEITKNFTTLLPDLFKNMQLEYDKNVKTVMMNTFDILNLVTREDFDAHINALKNNTLDNKALENTKDKVKILENDMSNLVTRKSFDTQIKTLKNKMLDEKELEKAKGKIISLEKQVADLIAKNKTSVSSQQKKEPSKV